MVVSRYNKGSNISSKNNADFLVSVILSVSLHLVLAVLTFYSPKVKRDFFTPTYQVQILPSYKAPVVDNRPQIGKMEDIKKAEKQPDKGKRAEIKAPDKKVKETVKGKTGQDKNRKTAAVAVKPKKEEVSPDRAIEKFREKVSAERAVEDMRKRVRDDKAAKHEDVKIAAAPPVKTYKYEELDNELKAYYNMIARMIREAWSLPMYLSNKGYETEISIRIRRDGSIDSLWIDKRSGNRSYDESTVRAINKAGPLPPLPDAWKDNYIDLGLRFKE